MLIGMISKNIAVCVSFLLGPQVWLPVFLFLFLTKTGLTKTQISVLLPILFTFQVAIPLLYIFIMHKKGKIADLDLTNREERILPVIIAFASLFVSLVTVRYVGTPLLFHLYTLLIILLCINGLITFFWKISFHMAINVAGSFIVNVLFGNQFQLLYITIPLVYWSRLTLKKHTPAQLIVSFILNTGVVYLFVHFFNLV